MYIIKYIEQKFLHDIAYIGHEIHVEIEGRLNI